MKALGFVLKLKRHLINAPNSSQLALLMLMDHCAHALQAKFRAVEMVDSMTCTLIAFGSHSLDLKNLLSYPLVPHHPAHEMLLCRPH